MRKFKFKSLTAFTLAEVLITLGIIGIIAAMTFPALLKHHRKVVIETHLKKFYTVMNQAILQSVNENGETKYWEFATTNNAVGSQDFYKRYFARYVKVLRASIENMNAASCFVVYFADGSGVYIVYYGKDWLYCTNARYLPEFNKYRGSKCFQFGFYPTFGDGANNTYPARNFYNKGIEPYVKATRLDENGNTMVDENGKPVSTTEKDLYSGGHYAKIIQMNGWTVPKDYPVKY